MLYDTWQNSSGVFSTRLNVRMKMGSLPTSPMWPILNFAIKSKNTTPWITNTLILMPIDHLISLHTQKRHRPVVGSLTQVWYHGRAIGIWESLQSTSTHWSNDVIQTFPNNRRIVPNALRRFLHSGNGSEPLWSERIDVGKYSWIREKFFTLCFWQNIYQIVHQ